MEFCPKCNSLLKPDNTSSKPLLSCSCGYSKEPDVKEHREIIKHKEDKRTVGTEIHPLAVYEHICSKCGFNKAQLISKGIWYSDEDEVQEFVCGKCGNHDRSEGIRGK